MRGQGNLQETGQEGERGELTYIVYMQIYETVVMVCYENIDVKQRASVRLEVSGHLISW